MLLQGVDLELPKYVSTPLLHVSTSFVLISALT